MQKITFSLFLMTLTLVSCGNRNPRAELAASSNSTHIPTTTVVVTGKNAAAIIDNYRLTGANYSKDGSRKFAFSCIAKDPSSRDWAYAECYRDRDVLKVPQPAYLNPYNVKETYYMMAAMIGAVSDELQSGLSANIKFQRLGYKKAFAVRDFYCNRLRGETGVAEDKCEFTLVNLFD